MNKIPMTVGGYARLQEELKRLKSVDRPAVIRAIAEARTHGDIAENAEYHAARERQSFIEGRLGELEDKIARAEVIDVSKLSGSAVKFGATVTLPWRDKPLAFRDVQSLIAQEPDAARRRQAFAAMNAVRVATLNPRLEPFYREVTAAIRAVDPGRIVIKTFYCFM